MVVAQPANRKDKSSLKRQPPSKNTNCRVTHQSKNVPKSTCIMWDVSKVETKLREAFTDPPPPGKFYHSMLSEGMRYSMEPPPLWGGSPRSSMCIVDSTTRLSRNVELFPELPTTKRRRKTVHFSTNEDKVYSIDYSPPCATSTSATWYERTEYARFKNQTKETILALYRARGQLNKLDIDEYTISGLEKSLTYRQITGRKKACTMYIQMILTQQFFCDVDPMQLRQMSEQFTNSSRERAHIRAMIDHELLLSEQR